MGQYFDLQPSVSKRRWNSKEKSRVISNMIKTD